MKEVSEVEKPDNEMKFKAWLKSKFGLDINDKYKFYYETVTQKLKSDFEKSEIWSQILKNLPEINDKYRIDKGVHLLIPTEIPTIYYKSLDSLVVKAFRKNILNNANYPTAPNGGWVTPENWFENINDIITKVSEFIFPSNKPRTVDL